MPFFHMIPQKPLFRESHIAMFTFIRLSRMTKLMPLQIPLRPEHLRTHVTHKTLRRLLLLITMGLLPVHLQIPQVLIILPTILALKAPLIRVSHRVIPQLHFTTETFLAELTEKPLHPQMPPQMHPQGRIQGEALLADGTDVSPFQRVPVHAQFVRPQGRVTVVALAA